MFMELDGLLTWLYEAALSTNIREIEWLFPMIESLHVLAVTVFLGSIVWVDLRILGVANKDRDIRRFSKELLPITWTMFVIAVITGLALFTSNAVNYAHNIYFQFKILLLILSGINMLVFQLWFSARTESYDPSHAARISTGNLAGMGKFRQKLHQISFFWSGKWSALLSILLWMIVIGLGQWIGFSMLPTVVR